MINHYRRGWALRYIREAKAELLAAKKTPRLASSLILEALRKARFAVYYSLGDPASIEMIVHKASSNGHEVKDPILKFLVEIEQMVQFFSEVPDFEYEKTIEYVSNLIQTASDIVELFTGEKA